MIDTNIAIHARDGTESVLESWHEGTILLSALGLAPGGGRGIECKDWNACQQDVQPPMHW